MNLRRLVFDFVDPAIPLERRDRSRVRQRAQQLQSEYGSAIAGIDRERPSPLTKIQIVILAASPLLFFVAICLCLQQSMYAPLPLIVLVATYLVLVSVAGLKIRPYLSAALREVGYETCPSCGYWLRELPDDVSRCPECGADRIPMPESPQ